MSNISRGHNALGDPVCRILMSGMTDLAHSITIDRCVCFDRTFAEILTEAQRREVSDLDTLRELLDFGQGCTCCLPYVERALETGQTEFNQLIP